MFKFQEKIHKSNLVKKIRAQIYSKSGPGYFIINKFISSSLADNIFHRWFETNFIDNFAQYYPNKNVNFETPNYCYRKPSNDDLIFAVNIWNPEPDTELNDIVYEAQKVRNVIEGKPLTNGLRVSDDYLLSYRFCKTVSNQVAVKYHQDFFEEFRPDPAGSQQFDPVRCQLTLIFSNYGEDYDSGGFYFTNTEGKEILFGKDVPVEKGDLIIWKYNHLHTIRNINAINPNKGFVRIIFPYFDNFNMIAKESFKAKP